MLQVRRPPPPRQVAVRHTVLYHGARGSSRVAAPPSSPRVSTEEEIPVVDVDSHRAPLRLSSELVRRMSGRRGD